MIKTNGQTEDFRGSAPSVSPTAQKAGVFSLCSGGVPVQGSFGRVPGKTLRNAGSANGGAISIFQFGNKIVVQRFSGVEIYDLVELAPNLADYVYDNFGNIIVDNFGIPITT